MMSNIEDIILDTGLFGSVWNIDTAKVGKYISKHSWMYATIAYNKENDINLSIPHGQLKPKREKSKEIMHCKM